MSAKPLEQKHDAPGPSVEPLPPTLSQGDIIDGRWRIEGKLGQGGMGVVLLGYELALGRRVAIKLIAEHLCGDATATERFEREARLMAQLSHPHIVPVHAFGEHRGRPFIVMKHLEGQPLSARLKSSGPMPMGQALRVASQLADALAFIHQQGCVHRDVKPSNVFVDDEGNATLLDFGIVKDLEGATATGSGQQLGTLEYMAPEQLVGAQSVGPASDVYSLCVVVFEMLTGARPYSREESLLSQLKNRERVPDLHALRPDLPVALAAALRKGMDPRPSHRFPSAEAARKAFEDIAEGAGVVSPRGSGARAILGVTAALLVAVGFGTVGIQKSAHPSVVAEPKLPVERSSKPVEARPGLNVIVEAQQPENLTRLRADVPTRQAGLVRKPRVAPARPSSPGTLNVVTSMAGRSTWAEVTVDGIEAGQSPTSIRLPSGSHQIVLERRGLKRVERTVQLPPGVETSLEVDLTP